ncbi:MAG: polyphosphate kinase 2 [Burkholderiales bacterium]|nr:polyphosphate kinase 2 [Burkholderiales bacterium]ODU67479.1 MAG: polyphosphate kinase 2 [Lautropia sp. SCN 66-9]
MKPMKKKDYEAALEPLQLELNNLAHWLAHTGTRLMVLLEGRDAAGKGGVIATISERLNPRQVRAAALPKPTERELTQWYFQRYVAHLPAAGEMVLFDRSWYNRAGVEKVMGYCTETQYALFLKQVPVFEKMLVDDGILLFKYWLAVDQAYQEERFAERAADPLKRWKLSPIDLESRKHYAAYGRARDAMFEATHSKHAPWHVVDFDDQRRGRLNLIRHLLDQVPDLAVPVQALELPPLPGKPQKEHFAGAVKPIRDRY